MHIPIRFLISSKNKGDSEHVNKNAYIIYVQKGGTQKTHHETPYSMFLVESEFIPNWIPNSV